MKLLVLDNIDSFTFMLVDYLRQAGAECQVVRNTAPLADIVADSYDAVVLSPGPGTPRQAGCLMAVVEHYHARLPVLGVCLGHQALGEFFGARLDRADRPMHGKRSQIRLLADDPLWRGLPETFEVTRYHSLLLRNLPTVLTPLAETTAPAAASDAAHGGEMMAFRHDKLPIHGVQFHPEAALTQHGLEMLQNWITFANKAQ